MNRLNKIKGMTLIELMIVVVIVGILASIAYPSYRDQMTKTRRSDGQVKLMEIMNAQERYFTNYGSYTASITAADPAGAQGVQANDGNLTFNSQGVKAPAEKW